VIAVGSICRSRRGNNDLPDVAFAICAAARSSFARLLDNFRPVELPVDLAVIATLLTKLVMRIADANGIIKPVAAAYTVYSRGGQADLTL